MMTRERQGRFFLVFSSLTLLLTQSNGQNVPNTQPRSGVEILVSLAVNNSASSTLDIERQTQIASFFASQTQAGCGTRCSVNASNVVFSEIGTGTATDPVSTALIFSMRVRIELPDNSVVLAVQSSLKLSQSVLTESLLASPDLGLSIHVYAIAYTRQADRPFVCGDNIIQNAEICDDGNTIDGDGCSAECTLEDGFMCYGAVRTGMANVTGKKGEWRVDALTNIKNFIVLDTAETCAKDGICIQATNPWVPSYFSAAYALGPVTSLAPGGFYCNDFCTDTFTPPKFYDFKNSCVPTGIDECSLGESTCDTNAYCTEPADKVGYSCECDEKYFVSTLHGASCATSGVEVEFKMGGMVPGSGTSAENIETNRQNMVEARLIFIDELFRQQYLNAQSSPALLIEGVNRYPIDMVSELIEDSLSPLYGRSLWRIVLRAPDVHLNLAKLAQGTIFDDTGTWARVFNDSSKFMVSRVGQCANDRARSCNSGNPSCLNAALCITDRADFTVKKLDAGGTTAPLQVDSSGLDVMSVEYDITQSAFKIRMRYDNTIPGVINTVFVSNMGVGQDPIFLPTFSSDEFPCLPIGTGLFQNQRDNSGAAETVFRVG